MWVSLNIVKPLKHWIFIPEIYEHIISNLYIQIYFYAQCNFSLKHGAMVVLGEVSFSRFVTTQCRLTLQLSEWRKDNTYTVQRYFYVLFSTIDYRDV